MDTQSRGYILALDQGTTSTRAILFDAMGNAIKKAQRPLAQHYPQPGWVEHDPAEIWEAQLGTMREAGSGREREIRAIGITNQRESTVIWDRRTGQPVGPVIVWQDRRTAALCDALREQGHAPFIRESTGLELDPYFSATKIAWVLSQGHDPSNLAFGTVDTFLLWQLTEGYVHATDVTNASRTMLFDLRTGAWSPELCELFGVPMSMLPAIRPSSSIFGMTTLFGGLVPIAAMAGDQHAATFGQACFEPGMAKNTYGTGCFLLANTGTELKYSTHGLLTTTAWKLKDEPTQFALEGSIFVAGAVIQWLCEELQIAESPEAAEVLAQSVASSDGVVIVPAFTGLGAPHWDPYARGTICGLTRGSGRAQICRAAFESIALQTLDLVTAMGADGGVVLTELRVDGGGAGSDYLMQLQADLLGIPVVRPNELETTARGVAFLAGLSTGFWTGLDEIAELCREQRRFEPRMSLDERDAMVATWNRAVTRAKDWESR